MIQFPSMEKFDFDSVPYVVNFGFNHNSIPLSWRQLPNFGGVGTKTEYTGRN